MNFQKRKIKEINKLKEIQKIQNLEIEKKEKEIINKIKDPNPKKRRKNNSNKKCIKDIF